MTFMHPSSHRTSTPLRSPFSYLEQHDPWLFFFKPSGVHTARAGKKGGGYSLEDALAHIVPAHMQQHNITLCTRLDAATSGIVVGTYKQEGHDIWRHMEQNMRTEKRYIALVKSHRDKSMPPVRWTVPFAIDMHKRKISKVLPVEAQAQRHTHFQYLHTLTHDDCENMLTYAHSRSRSLLQEHMDHIHLVGCTLFQGARHQIRAHAAYSSYSLWNDVRYGERRIPVSEDFFFLHHGGLFLPHSHITLLPDWIFALNTDIQKGALQFLQKKKIFF